MSIQFSLQGSNDLRAEVAKEAMASIVNDLQKIDDSQIMSAHKAGTLNVFTKIHLGLNKACDKCSNELDKQSVIDFYDLDNLTVDTFEVCTSCMKRCKKKL